MKRSEAALAGAQQLFRAENAVDGALREAGALVTLLPSLRMDAGLSAMHGPTVMHEVSDAIMALANARGALLKAHASLEAVRGQIGCRSVAIGDMDKPQEGNVPRTGHLVVAGGRDVA